MEIVVGTKILKYHAREKKRRETVVFVHHMFGSYRTSLRHQRMLHEWGFDAVSFDLIAGSHDHFSILHPLILKLHQGVFEIWKQFPFSEQILG